MQKQKQRKWTEREWAKYNVAEHFTLKPSSHNPNIPWSLVVTLVWLCTLDFRVQEQDDPEPEVALHHWSRTRLSCLVRSDRRARHAAHYSSPHWSSLKHNHAIVSSYYVKFLTSDDVFDLYMFVFFCSRGKTNFLWGNKGLIYSFIHSFSPLTKWLICDLKGCMNFKYGFEMSCRWDSKRFCHFLLSLKTAYFYC